MLAALYVPNNGICQVLIVITNQQFGETVRKNNKHLWWSIANKDIILLTNNIDLNLTFDDNIRYIFIFA